MNYTTMTFSSVNLRSKIIYNVLMLPISIKSVFNTLVLLAATTHLGKLFQ